MKENGHPGSRRTRRRWRHMLRRRPPCSCFYCVGHEPPERSVREREARHHERAANGA